MSPLKSLSILLVLVLATVALSGCLQSEHTPTNRPDYSQPGTAQVVLADNWPEFPTYKKINHQLLLEDGKPVVMLFGTSKCPNCTWLADSFDKAAKEYMDQGKIVAYHWVYDADNKTWNNTLTDEAEGDLPADDMTLFLDISGGGSVPAFYMAGKYVKIGAQYKYNGDYEGLTGLDAMEGEMRAVLDALIAQAE